MSYVLSELSETITGLTAAAAPFLVAIRLGQGRHITGLVWSPSLIITPDDSLDMADSHTIVLASGMLATARTVARDPVRNLAALRPDQPIQTVAMTPSTRVNVGALVIVVGADSDGAPTARLTTIFRHAKTAGQDPVLDLPPDRASPGALVLDALSGMLGMAAPAPNGETGIKPYHVIGRFAEELPLQASVIAEPPRLMRPPPRAVAPGHTSAPPSAGRPGMAARPPLSVPGASSGERRAWLGVALQPITVPEPMVARAGQASGRLVVSVSPGGPADLAGLRTGDVVLSLNGQGTNGPHALRDFLDNCPIGSQVEVRVLRDNAVSAVMMTMTEHP